MKKIGKILQRVFLLLLTFSMCGLAGMTATMLWMKPEFESTIRMVVLSPYDMETMENIDGDPTIAITKDYAQLMQSHMVWEHVLMEYDFSELNEEALQKKIKIDNPSGTHVIMITAEDQDPYRAAELANAVQETAARYLPSMLNVEKVNVVDKANIPDKISGPDRIKNGILVGIAGCVLAIIFMIIGKMTDQTIKTEKDVMRKLHVNVWGTIRMSKMKPKRNNKRRRRR